MIDLRRAGSPAKLPFAFAVLVLGIAAVLAGPMSRWARVSQVKAPLPLKEPLATFDVAALGPYRVIDRQILESTIVEALGTDQYLSWTLEDTSLAERDPLRVAQVLVTYYSGGKDLVPHTPDVCYTGAGYAEAQPHENQTINVAALGGLGADLPIRVLTFEKTAIHQRSKLSVVYTFFCNGEFVATRTDVRLRTNHWANTHGFFSKVEVSFPRGSREQVVTGATRLFERLLPILVEKHWPDFAAAEAATKQGS